VALIAEELGQGDAGERRALTGAGWLVHLAEHQGDLVQHVPLTDIVEQVVAFARALADAREDRVAAVLFGDIPDQLLDDDGLADPGTAKDADFPAAWKWRDQVDDFDPGLEHLGLDELLHAAAARGHPPHVRRAARHAARAAEIAERAGRRGPRAEVTGPPGWLLTSWPPDRGARGFAATRSAPAQQW
jgi:hypothetical protein